MQNRSLETMFCEMNAVVNLGIEFHLLNEDEPQNEPKQHSRYKKNWTTIKGKQDKEMTSIIPNLQNYLHWAKGPWERRRKRKTEKKGVWEIWGGGGGVDWDLSMATGSLRNMTRGRRVVYTASEIRKCLWAVSECWNSRWRMLLTFTDPLWGLHNIILILLNCLVLFGCRLMGRKCTAQSPFPRRVSHRGFDVSPSLPSSLSLSLTLKYQMSPLYPPIYQTMSLCGRSSHSASQTTVLVRECTSFFLFLSSFLFLTSVSILCLTGRKMDLAISLHLTFSFQNQEINKRIPQSSTGCCRMLRNQITWKDAFIWQVQSQMFRLWKLQKKPSSLKSNIRRSQLTEMSPVACVWQHEQKKPQKLNK